MKLTTKGRYAVTAMLDLALNSSVSPVSLAQISERQSISLSYLEQLFAKLRKHELVVSTRGPGGGYRVSRQLSDIAVGDIISAVDESVDATHCGGKENCRGDGPNGGRCLTHDLWVELSSQIEGFLSGISLEDLINKRVHYDQPLAESPGEHVNESEHLVEHSDGRPPEQLPEQLPEQRPVQPTEQPLVQQRA